MTLPGDIGRDVTFETEMRALVSARGCEIMDDLFDWFEVSGQWKSTRRFHGRSFTVDPVEAEIMCADVGGYEAARTLYLEWLADGKHSYVELRGYTDDERPPVLLRQAPTGKLPEEEPPVVALGRLDDAAKHWPREEVPGGKS